MQPLDLEQVSVLAVDIAGTISLDHIIPVLLALRRACRPRLTVCKSIHLRKFAKAVCAGEEEAAGQVHAATGTQLPHHKENWQSLHTALCCFALGVGIGAISIRFLKLHR